MLPKIHWPMYLCATTLRTRYATLFSAPGTCTCTNTREGSYVDSAGTTSERLHISRCLFENLYESVILHNATSGKERHGRSPMRLVFIEFSSTRGLQRSRFRVCPCSRLSTCKKKCAISQHANYEITREPQFANSFHNQDICPKVPRFEIRERPMERDAPRKEGGKATDGTHKRKKKKLNRHRQTDLRQRRTKRQPRASCRHPTGSVPTRAEQNRTEQSRTE
ncbi:hypothetical protein DFH11DRAFT_1663119 [Phellopilus nigrolimitatus]|nr:hypothetical protein DFH11DRAFT_1663119 [Phellopilus nigrolimitatus]